MTSNTGFTYSGGINFTYIAVNPGFVNIGGGEHQFFEFSPRETTCTFSLSHPSIRVYGRAGIVIVTEALCGV